MVPSFWESKNYKAIDKNGDMMLDPTEVGRVLKLDPKDVHMALIFMLLDLNRNKKIDFREYAIAASQIGQKEQSNEDKIRFCMTMVDKDNNGYVRPPPNSIQPPCISRWCVERGFLRLFCQKE